MSSTRTVRAACAAAAVAASTAGADVVFNLNYEFSGAQNPSGTGPWLKATFKNAGSNTVSLELKRLLNDADERVSFWGFNLDPAMDPTALGISQLTGPVASTIATGVNAFKADGDGFFDVKFEFANNGTNEFDGSWLTATFNLTMTGLTEDDFNFVSVNGPPNKNGFLSAAHVQGIPGGGSGWITQFVVVPVPPAAWLGGAGLAAAFGLAAIRRRRMT